MSILYLKNSLFYFKRCDKTIFVIGIIAFAIYLPGFWWGVPYASNSSTFNGWNIDGLSATGPLAEMYNMFIEAKPDWHLWYPPFHHIILILCYTPYLFYLMLSGGLSNPSGVYPFGLVDPINSLATLAIIGRLVTIIMASSLVVTAYVTAKIVWSRTTGILAAVFVMMSTPMFYYARTGNVDLPALLWIALTAFVIAGGLKRGFTIRRGIWLGIFSAFALGTKDQTYAPLLPALAIATIYHYRSQTTEQKSNGSNVWLTPLVAIISGGATYAFTSGLILSPTRFFRHFKLALNLGSDAFNIEFLNLKKPKTIEGYSELFMDIFGGLIDSLGPVILIVGIAGLVLYWRSDKFGKVLFVMIIGHLLLFLVPIRHMMFRYSMLPAFALAFFAARLLALQLHATKVRRITAFIVLVVGVGWLGSRGVDMTYQMIYDARYEAGKWLMRNTQKGDKVVYIGSTAQLPHIPVGVILKQIPVEMSFVKFLEQQTPEFVLIIPDWTSDVGKEYSQFLSESSYKSLNNGVIGYRRMALFQTKPLWKKFPMDLHSVINPKIQIYRRIGIYGKPRKR